MSCPAPERYFRLPFCGCLSLEEIAEEASLPIEQARQVRAAARAATSLDQPVGDFVAGEGLLPDELVELSLRSEALQQALAALSERERQVLVLRYGSTTTSQGRWRRSGAGSG